MSIDSIDIAQTDNQQIEADPPKAEGAKGLRNLEDEIVDLCNKDSEYIQQYGSSADKRAREPELIVSGQSTGRRPR